MISGKTSSGFVYEIDEGITNDMELLDLLVAVEENAYMLPKLVEKLLGREQKENLYNHVRNEKGQVPIDRITKEFEEIMATGEETKNS